MIKLGNRIINPYQIVRVIKADKQLQMTMISNQILHWDFDELDLPEHELSVGIKKLEHHISNHDWIEYGENTFVNPSHIAWIRFKKRSAHIHITNGQRFATFQQRNVEKLLERYKQLWI